MTAGNGQGRERSRGGTPELALQPRDLEVLRGFYECRAMTLRHAADLHFDGSYKAAQKRLARLKAAGYLRDKLVGGVADTTALCFRPKAYRELVERDALGDLPTHPWSLLEKRGEVSPLTLRHELDVVGLRAAVATSVRERRRAGEDAAVRRFTTWPRLCRFKARRLRPAPGGSPVLTLNPDGYFELERAREDGSRARLFFFVEVDRSTEQRERLVEKMHAYLDFYRRGGFARRQGAAAREYRQWPFRVLWTFRTEQRLKNAAEAFAAAQPRVGNMAWLAAHEAALNNPFGEVWRTPGDPTERALL